MGQVSSRRKSDISCTELDISCTELDSAELFDLATTPVDVGPAKPDEISTNKDIADELVESLECAICMCPIDSVAQLPCNCKVPYCQVCWDRWLAEDIRQHPAPRCPSCRSGVRVDFDDNACRLVFSLADQTSFKETLDRIGEQVRPFQRQILNRYGDEFPARGESSRCLNRSASWVDRRVQTKQAAPRCVCDGILNRTTVSERTIGKHFNSLLCDLCDKKLTGSDFVWSCDRGTQTIMHATAYDICDSCLDECIRGD